MMKTKAIVTGSFDPITAGHADIIRRAAAMFDTVYVVALNNVEKAHRFTEAQRLAMISAVRDELAGCGINNVVADSYSGQTADYMREHGISVIVRGVRNEADRVYEMELAAIMRELCPGCETVLLESDAKYSSISSTDVRKMLEAGADIAGLVTEGTAKIITDILNS